MLGYKIGIVSGGFSIVIDHIRSRFDLDYGLANTLEIKDGFLTGRILGDIIDGPMKANLSEKFPCAKKFLRASHCGGDGATIWRCFRKQALELHSMQTGSSAKEPRGVCPSQIWMPFFIFWASHATKLKLWKISGLTDE